MLVSRPGLFLLAIGALCWCSEGSAAQNAKPTTPVDRSLTANKYVEAGVPADDRPWTGSDMKAAAKTLVVFAKEDPGLLPRYQSNRSGKVFARITAKDNLEFFRNRSLPIESRLPDATRYLESLNTINKTYLGAFLKKSVGDSELIELVGATLRLPELLFELTEEFLPTLDKNDPTYKIRMDGVEKMKRGIALMAIGALQTLTENEVYRESELARLAESMKETFPKFVSRLPPASQKEALIRLKGLAEDPRRKYLQPAVRELYEATQASLPKQGPAK